MPIQPTDILLVRRAGTNYKAEASRAPTLLDADELAVNRGGVSYRLSGAALKAGTFLDSDLFLVNRGGVDYRAPGSEIRTMLAVNKAPVIGSVVLSELNAANGIAYTGQSFRTIITMAEDGAPPSTKALKGYVEGALNRVGATDQITNVQAVQGNFKITPWTQTTSSFSASVNQRGSGYGTKMAVFPASNARGILSTNNGNTWTEVNPNAGNSVILVGVGRANAWLFSTSTSNMRVTYDDFTTSTLVTGFAAKFSNSYIDVADTGAEYLTGSGSNTTLYRSTDLLNWTSSAQTFRVSSIAANGNNVVVYDSNAKSFHYSTDGGLTFQQSAISGTAPSNVGILVFHRGHFVFMQENIGLVTRSPDGVTFTSVGTPPAAKRLLLPTQNVLFAYQSSSATMYYSEDIGATWTLLPELFTNNATISAATFSDTAVAVGANLNAMYPATTGFTRLTLSGSTDLSNGMFSAGDFVKQNDNAASGSLLSIDTVGLTMDVSTYSGTWSANTGNYVVGTVSRSPAGGGTSRLYLRFGASGAVTDLQAADPGFVTTTNQTAPVLTFPATFPTGNAPDSVLPAGTTITTIVQATNPSGTVSMTSNTVTPT